MANGFQMVWRMEQLLTLGIGSLLRIDIVSETDSDVQDRCRAMFHKEHTPGTI